MARDVAKGFGAARAGRSPGHSPPQGDVFALSTTCERGARSQPELMGRQGTGALPLAAAGLTTRFERSGDPNGRAEFVGASYPLFFACQPTGHEDRAGAYGKTIGMLLAPYVPLVTLAISTGAFDGNQPVTERQILVEQGLAHARSLGDLHSSPVTILPPPPSQVAPPTSPSSQPILVPLAGALIQCVSLILIGYWCKRSGLFSAGDASGLSAFVGRLSLPALLFLSMATLDVQTIDTLLLCTILLVKCLVFVLVVISCRVTDGLEVANPARP